MKEEWEPTTQDGFSRVPILTKMDNDLYWVCVRAKLSYERSLREILRG